MPAHHSVANILGCQLESVLLAGYRQYTRIFAKPALGPTHWSTACVLNPVDGGTPARSLVFPDAYPDEYETHPDKFSHKTFENKKILIFRKRASRLTATLFTGRLERGTPLFFSWRAIAQAN